jgi:outer membrane protein assembly factor BamE
MNKSLALLLLPLLAGCGSWNPVNAISPHRIEVQQGNVVSQEMLAKLKPGMTPSQVRFVLGTPLIVDPFRDNRWDYVYSLKQKGKVVEQRRVTVVFEKGVLKGIEGDLVPAAKPGEAPAAQAGPPAVQPATPAGEVKP